MKIIVTGATGMVGAEVIRQAIEDNGVTAVTALVRRPLDIKHPKLNTIIHKDYLDYAGLEGIFQSHDACIWCLGISQTQVSKEQYEVITYLYTMKAAQAMLRANHKIGFVFLSGNGADQDEKARSTFARIKGKTENALKTLSFKRLHFARPGGIWPVHQNPNSPLLYKMFVPLYPLISKMFPAFVIKSDRLARALIIIAKNGYTETIVDNDALKAITE